MSQVQSSGSGFPLGGGLFRVDVYLPLRSSVGCQCLILEMSCWWVSIEQRKPLRLLGVQSSRCYAAFGSGRRWEVGTGNRVDPGLRAFKLRTNGATRKNMDAHAKLCCVEEVITTQTIYLLYVLFNQLLYWYSDCSESILRNQMS